MINSTEEQIYKFLNQAQDIFDRKILFNAAIHLKNKTFVEKPEWADILATCESREDPEAQPIIYEMERIIYNNIDKDSPLKKAFGQGDIQVIPKKQYLKMKPWIEKQQLYEEDRKIYVWITRDLFRGHNVYDMELVGGLFAKSKLIEKKPGYKKTEFYLGEQLDITPIVINPSPSILQTYIPEEAFHQLYNIEGKEDKEYKPVDLARLGPGLDIEGLNQGIPLQARIIPLINQNGQAAAYLILSMPIMGVWNILVKPMSYGFLIILVCIILAAVFMARSLARPIYELAETAHRMSQGEYDARVELKGTEEQQVLRSAFNTMAQQIERQFDQLKGKTKELEISNRDLNQTQHFLQNILANIRSGVLSVDQHGRISHVNNEGIKLLKLTEWRNKTTEETIHSPELKRLIRGSLESRRSVFQQEIPCQMGEDELLSLQVSTVPLMENNQPVGLVVTFHDLTDIRRLEEQVRRQDRLAALGRMAAGVAHEIRNPLGIIHGSAQLLNKRFREMEGEEGLSQFIIEEVNRLSRVVNDFLMFARPPVPSLEEVAPATLLDQVLTYAPSLDNCTIHVDVEPDIPSIAADSELTREAFLNLILNASEAMADGGTIALRASRCGKKEIVFEVIDEGSGIHPEIMDQIFDPFYTSKDSGTGLGLSLVHQIVSSQRGKVEVESVPNQGSIFRLIYPIWDSQTQAKPAKPLSA